MRRPITADLLGLILFSVQAAFIIFLVSFFLGSFLAGASNCHSCQTMGDRALLGLIWLPLSVLTLGHVPMNAGGGATISVWPYVQPLWGTATLFQLAVTAWVWRRSRRA